MNNLLKRFFKLKKQEKNLEKQWEEDMSDASRNDLARVMYYTRQQIQRCFIPTLIDCLVFHELYSNLSRVSNDWKNYDRQSNGNGTTKIYIYYGYDAVTYSIRDLYESPKLIYYVYDEGFAGGINTFPIFIQNFIDENIKICKAKKLLYLGL